MRHPFVGMVPTYQLRGEGLDRWPASSYRRPTPYSVQKRPAPSRFGAPRHPGEGLRDACSGGMRHPFIGTVPTYQLRDEGLDRWPASSYRRPTPETLGSVLKRPWLEMPFRVFGTKAMRLFPCVDWCPLLSLPLSLSLSLSASLSLFLFVCVCVCVCVFLFWPILGDRAGCRPWEAGVACPA